MAKHHKTRPTRAQRTKKKRKSKSKNTKKNKAFSTTVATTVSPHMPSGFLALPPELRDIIYCYALVRNEPIKAQSPRSCNWYTGRFYFTMSPGLAMVPKQVGRESQRIFFKENQFEVGTALLQHRSLAPLTIFKKMHRPVGLAIRTLRVSFEVERRRRGDVFLFNGSFTLSKTGPELSVSDAAYGIAYTGWPRRAQPNYDFRVRGCLINSMVFGHRGLGIVHFLETLRRDYFGSVDGTGGSRRGDWDYVVYDGVECEDCKLQGLTCIQF